MDAVAPFSFASPTAVMLNMYSKHTHTQRTPTQPAAQAATDKELPWAFPTCGTWTGAQASPLQPESEARYWQHTLNIPSSHSGALYRIPQIPARPCSLSNTPEQFSGPLILTGWPSLGLNSKLMDAVIVLISQVLYPLASLPKKSVWQACPNSQLRTWWLMTQ